jgi:hypothetical protein
MRLVWCLGMYASASTWLFNVIRQMAAGESEVYTHFIAGGIEPEVFDRGGLQLVKSHEITDDFAVEWLARNTERIFVTIRDPRDAVTSLMQYHGYDFERALAHVDASARLCVRFANDERTVFWPYESRFFENEESLARIEIALGMGMEAAVRSTLFGSMQRAHVEAHIAKFPTMRGVLQDRVSGDMLDPRTHWHTHHAGRSGEIGRWKHALSAEQVVAVDTKLHGCFSFEG